MGTRCLTFVYDGGTAVINMYRQFDGYPEGHGRELSDFLSQFDAVVNGMALNETRKVANGMGCLAAQMIAHFKQTAGGFYIHPVYEYDCGQEYEYHVYEDKVIVKNPDEVIFQGDWKEFASFCEEPADVEE
jgi:hypothetical protein